MVSVAEIRSPHDGAPDAAPRRLLRTVPDVDLELESFVSMGDRAVPYLWAWGEHLGDFDRTIATIDGFEDVERLQRVEDGALYRVEWSVDFPLIECVQRASGRLLDAYVTAERLDLTVLLEDGDDASAFRRCCRDADVPIHVERLRPVVDVRGEEPSTITGPQREALLTAYDGGYFEQPRESTQSEIAEQLGISAAAIGARLRRGTAHLIENQLLE